MATPAPNFTTCQADPAIERVEIEGFKFPLGVYPVEDVAPKAGYVMEFEPSDGNTEENDWEEWPDRYMFDVVISADRLQAFCRHVFWMLPGRVFPILDVLGHDAYREIDPYISYDLVSVERFYDALRRYNDFFFEDGMAGFGAMSESPFFYAFVDEHKIVTIRVEPSMKEKIEKLLEAFDLEPTRGGSEPAGADAAAHEHRTVLLMPEDSPELLGPDEIVERLRDDWALVLNIDPDTNNDEDGQELGVTPWRCVVRCEPAEGKDVSNLPRYAEIVLDADSLRDAEEIAFEATDQLCEAGKFADSYDDAVLLQADRILPETLKELLKGEAQSESERKAKSPRGKRRKDLEKADESDDRVKLARWLDIPRNP